MVLQGLKIPTDQPFPLVLSGGNFTVPDSMLTKIVGDKVATLYPQCKIALPSIDIAHASALLIHNRDGHLWSK